MKINKFADIFNIASITSAALFCVNYDVYFKQFIGNDLRVIKYLFPVGLLFFAIALLLTWISNLKKRNNCVLPAVSLTLSGCFLLFVGIFTSNLMHAIAPVLLIQTSVLIASYANAIFHIIAYMFLGIAFGVEIKHSEKSSIAFGIGFGVGFAAVLKYIVSLIGTQLIFIALGVVIILAGIVNAFINHKLRAENL